MSGKKKVIVKESKLDELNDHKKRSYDHSLYSIQRFDLLMVGISSFAILQGLGVVKFVIEKSVKVNLSFLWISVIVFVITILSNLISQLMTHYSNVNEYFLTEERIMNEREDKDYSPENEAKFREKSDQFDKWNSRLNYISLSSLFIGIVLFGVFLIKIASTI